MPSSSSSDEDDDYVFFGTKLEQEFETRGSTYRKPVQDPSATRALPVWKQEVTDERGRKRFHGAFTGGFSAGYFNTVGSKGGFEPKSFRSSRGDKLQGAAEGGGPGAAEQKYAQKVEDFMDEDEIEERGKSALAFRSEYDTYGTNAVRAALAVKPTTAESDARHMLSLGFGLPGSGGADPAALGNSVAEMEVAAIVALPIVDGVGVRLLQKMGWRQGRGLRPDDPSARDGAAPRRGRWGAMAGISAENTPLYIPLPKDNRHGLGYDPFLGAEEFRQAKRQRLRAAGISEDAISRTLAPGGGDAPKLALTAGPGGGGIFGGSGGGLKAIMGSVSGVGAGRRQARGGTGRVAFGTGALEDTDTFGYMEDYVDDEADAESLGRRHTAGGMAALGLLRDKPEEPTAARRRIGNGEEDSDDEYGVPGASGGRRLRLASTAYDGSNDLKRSTGGGGSGSDPAKRLKLMAACGANYNFEMVSDDSGDEAAARARPAPLRIGGAAPESLLLLESGPKTAANRRREAGGGAADALIEGFIPAEFVGGDEGLPLLPASGLDDAGGERGFRAFVFTGAGAGETKDLAPVPENFREFHLFPFDATDGGTSSSVHLRVSGGPPPPPPLPPPPVEPPANSTLRLAIEALASQVARSGPIVEDLAKKRALAAAAAAAVGEESKTSASVLVAADLASEGGVFSFLVTGGPAMAYYQFKLFRFKASLAALLPPPPPAMEAPVGAASAAGARRLPPPQLTPEMRMRMLGETPLPVAGGATIEKGFPQAFAQPASQLPPPPPLDPYMAAAAAAAANPLAAAALQSVTTLAFKKKQVEFLPPPPTPFVASALPPPPTLPPSLVSGGGAIPHPHHGSNAALAAQVMNIPEANRSKIQDILGRSFVKPSEPEAPLFPRRPFAAPAAVEAARLTSGSQFAAGSSAETAMLRPEATGGLQSAADLRRRREEGEAKKREEQQELLLKIGRKKRDLDDWAPQPLLCKRLNIPDPFKGRARDVPQHGPFSAPARANALLDIWANNMPTVMAAGGAASTTVTTRTTTAAAATKQAMTAAPMHPSTTSTMASATVSTTVSTASTAAATSASIYSRTTATTAVGISTSAGAGAGRGGSLELAGTSASVSSYPFRPPMSSTEPPSLAAGGGGVAGPSGTSVASSSLSFVGSSTVSVAAVGGGGASPLAAPERECPGVPGERGSSESGTRGPDGELDDSANPRLVPEGLKKTAAAATVSASSVEIDRIHLLDRPMDLFKAIFDDDDEDEDEEQRDGEGQEDKEQGGDQAMGGSGGKGNEDEDKRGGSLAGNGEEKAELRDGDVSVQEVMARIPGNFQEQSNPRIIIGGKDDPRRPLTPKDGGGRWKEESGAKEPGGPGGSGASHRNGDAPVSLAEALLRAQVDSRRRAEAAAAAAAAVGSHAAAGAVRGGSSSAAAPVAPTSTAAWDVGLNRARVSDLDPEVEARILAALQSVSRPSSRHHRDRKKDRKKDRKDRAQRRKEKRREKSRKKEKEKRKEKRRSKDERRRGEKRDNEREEDRKRRRRKERRSRKDRHGSSDGDSSSGSSDSGRASDGELVRSRRKPEVVGSSSQSSGSSSSSSSSSGSEGGGHRRRR